VTLTGRRNKMRLDFFGQVPDLAHNMQSTKSLAELVFDKADTDKSGSISTSEFRYLCQSLGYGLSKRESDIAAASLDHVRPNVHKSKNKTKSEIFFFCGSNAFGQDGDSRVDKREFLQWWRTENR
jgi:Ca2+-binding EF-hand superfamily protein